MGLYAHQTIVHKQFIRIFIGILLNFHLIRNIFAVFCILCAYLCLYIYIFGCVCAWMSERIVVDGPCLLLFHYNLLENIYHVQYTSEPV